jgi:hypothetical protein
MIDMVKAPAAATAQGLRVTDQLGCDRPEHNATNGHAQAHPENQANGFYVPKDIKSKRRRPSPEALIHRALADHLRLRAKPDVLWLHVPNGERRDKITGAKLKRMGVLAGASDFLFWHNGNSFALELKAPDGRLSEAQLDFLARFNDAGGHSAVAEGIDRALAVLESWNLLRGRAS